MCYVFQNMEAEKVLPLIPTQRKDGAYFLLPLDSSESMSHSLSYLSTLVLPHQRGTVVHRTDTGPIPNYIAPLLPPVVRDPFGETDLRYIEQIHAPWLW